MRICSIVYGMYIATQIGQRASIAISWIFDYTCHDMYTICTLDRPIHTCMYITANVLHP